MAGQRKRTEQEKAEITPQRKAGLTLQEADGSTPQKANVHTPQKTSDQAAQESAARMLQEELPHLQEIQKILREQLDTTDTLLEKSQRDIIGQKKYLWENFYELDPKEILSNRTSITEEHSLHEMKLTQKRMLLKLQENPYFGRIDFAYDGEDEAETVYIGLSGLQSRDRLTHLIYDWRAPISGMYYDFDIGRAYYEAPAGRFEGELLQKRQLKIKNGMLQYVLSSGFPVGDELLQRELARNGSPKMQNIVATIQREQNSVVRDETSSILLVQGAAGSGKTSVALHRIAFLLYRNRNSLHSGEILILSPNRIFAEYISDVLPELGEQNICEVSFDDIARRETAGISEIGECETKQEQLEFIIRCEPEDARLQQIRFKRSLLFLRELQAFVRELEDELVSFADYTFSLPARTQDDCTRSCTVTADELQKLYRGNFSALPVFQRLGQIAERIAEHFESEHHIFLSTPRRDEIVQGLYAMCRTTNVRTLYAEFLRSISEKYSVPENGGNAGEGCLRYEDIFPVVLMKLLLFGRPNSRFARIRHVVVDEMQDYSMVQYELLRVLFRCSMTILGDTGQMLDCGGDTLLDDIRGVFGPKTTIVRLEKSYRSTLEISEFCRRLGGTSGTQAFARRGKAPALRKCLDYPDMVLRLQSRMDRIDPVRTATAAVICKTAAAAERLYLALDSAHRERCHRMNAEEDDFREGILITNSCLAKGLEFDLVIVPEADAEEYRTDRDRRILYIACTRALHELELWYFGTPSPFLIFGDAD